MVFSITEGEEKPLEYPVMFRPADAIVVNKMDLLPHLDFDLDLIPAPSTASTPSVDSDPSRPVTVWVRPTP